jgi:hypothetical protein
MKKYFHTSISATKRYLVYAFVVIFAAHQSLMACPNCKEGFDKGTEQAAAGAAYSLTICFLLLVPITIIGVMVWKVRRQVQHHAAKQALAIHDETSRAEALTSPQGNQQSEHTYKGRLHNEYSNETFQQSILN